METGLQGQVVVVTGPSGGIGAAVARAFAAEGARLVLHYRSNRGEAEQLAAAVGSTESLIVRADLTQEREVRRMFAAGIRRFGRMDTLVANAASWEMRDVPVHEMSLRQWQRTVDSVWTATFLSVREHLRYVARQRRGNLVLIGSTAGVFGEAGHADYAAAKAGLAYGLTRTLKNELSRIAPHTRDYCGGRVNCVASNQGGGISFDWGTLNITSTIVGYNAAGSNQDIRTYGVTTNADHTLVALAAGHSISDGIDGNIVGQEPLLDVLKDNGGLTETHLLLEGSPAINTGANPHALTNDQRGPGFPREIGSVDMGAVETDSGLAPGTWQVDSTDDENDGNFSSGNLSLREAITNAPGGAAITFEPTVFTDPAAGTITLALGELTINKPLAIDGDNRVTIDAGGSRSRKARRERPSRPSPSRSPPRAGAW